MSGGQAPSADRRMTSAVTGSRGRVLASVRAARGPARVADLATRLQLHPNTVRFHLDVLESKGLVERASEPTGGKGRPRSVYRATVEGERSGGDRNYQLLSEVLVELVAASCASPASAARDAGRAWGRRIRDTGRLAEPSRRRSQAATLVEALDELGFDPEPEPRRRPARIWLHNCPFREAVDRQQEIVCALHLGLIQGLMRSVERADEVELKPFVQPALCVAHLTRR